MFASYAEDAGLEERPFSHQTKPIVKAWPDPAQMSEILEIACNSKKPVLIGGHGVWWSGSEKKLEEVDGLQDHLYDQICEASILKYQSADLGIDDVEYTDEVVGDE